MGGPLRLGGGVPSDFTPIITLTTISDQDDLSAMTVSLNTVTIGGVTKTPSAVAFRVNGATTGLADPTAVGGTTFTPTRGGEYTIGGTVTIDGVPYPITPQTRTVGRLMFGGWAYLAEHTDWTAVTQTLSDGVGYTPNSLEYTPEIPSGCTMIASGDADGLDVDNTGAASSARITASLAGLGSNSTRIAVVWRSQLYSVSSGGSFSGCGIEDADNSHKTQAWRDKSGADWLAATLQRVASSNASPTATNVGTTECEWQMAVLENGAKEAANLYSTSNTDAMPDIGDFTEYQRYPMVASAFDATGFSRSTDIALWAIATAEGGKILDTMVWVWS